MIAIKKEEPEWFYELKNAHKRWNYRDLPSPERRNLRKSLLEDQYYLCGYCCCEIDLEESHTEHLKPRSKHPKQALDYQNLIASCSGYKDNLNTCGKKKDDSDADIVLPTDLKCENQFEYSFDGRIIGKNQKAEETIKTLNLNSYALRQARKSVLEAAFYWEKDDAEVYYNIPQDGRLPAFCNIVRWMLHENGDCWTEFKNLI